MQAPLMHCASSRAFSQGIAMASGHIPQSPQRLYVIMATVGSDRQYGVSNTSNQKNQYYV